MRIFRHATSVLGLHKLHLSLQIRKYIVLLGISIIRESMTRAESKTQALLTAFGILLLSLSQISGCSKVGNQRRDVEQAESKPRDHGDAILSIVRSLSNVRQYTLPNDFHLTIETRDTTPLTISDAAANAFARLSLTHQKEFSFIIKADRGCYLAIYSLQCRIGTETLNDLVVVYPRPDAATPLPRLFQGQSTEARIHPSISPRTEYYIVFASSTQFDPNDAITKLHNPAVVLKSNTNAHRLGNVSVRVIPYIVTR